MKVNVEDVIEMMKFRKMINSINLDQIEWILNGENQIISSESIREFEFIGLNNTDFVSYYFNDVVENSSLDSLNIHILSGYKKE